MIVRLNLDAPQRLATTPESLAPDTLARASLAEARRRLATPGPSSSMLPLLGASALLALSALVLAASIILGPFWQTRDSPAVSAAEAQALR